MYCIYTDLEVAEADGNWDHIIPLSLGGTNQFQVWSQEAFNSQMGSEVDGALASDPLLAPGLARAPIKGHGKKPAPRWRRATIAGRPAQISHTPEGMRVWDARAGRELADHESAGEDLTVELKIGMFTALRFLAKVALGGGYFVYGNALLTAIDCDSLRKVIALDIEAAKTDEALLSCGIQIVDRFHPDAEPDGSAYLYRVICEMVPRSILITEPFANGIAFHVGVLGTYIGTIFCPGNTQDIPVEGEHHHRGHAIVLAPGTFTRHSFEALLLDLKQAIDAGSADADASGPAA